jgi:hypothetical protein
MGSETVGNVLSLASAITDIFFGWLNRTSAATYHML